jgi:adenylate cyclase
MDSLVPTRRLAAIMFTDMVGFSTLAQRNEPLALELLAEHQGLLREKFTRFHGREVKPTGDGFLVEFPSG